MSNKFRQDALHSAARTPFLDLDLVSANGTTDYGDERQFSQTRRAGWAGWDGFNAERKKGGAADKERKWFHCASRTRTKLFVVDRNRIIAVIGKN